ncbi:MAG: site-specific integrase [Rhodocyclaceae bacterium]
MTASTTTHSNIINMTPRALSGLARPTQGKSREYTDAKVRHLKAEVTAAGTITFWFRGQRDGRRCPVRIGQFPAIGVEEARRTALEYKAQLDRGEDPTAERKALKAQQTLGEFFEEYLKDAKARGKASWKDDRSRFHHRVGPKFGERKLGTILKKEIAQFHASLREEVSVASANRIFSLISAIYRKAVEWEAVPTNPCSGLKQFKESNARTRFLDEAEMAAFTGACAAEPNRTAADLLTGLALTGLRKSELRNAAWADVNLERGELRLETTKNGDGRTVVLSDDMKALLGRLPSRNQSAWLFPGRDGTQPLVNVDKPFRRIIARAGLAGKDLTIHSLRHTLASYMAINGESLHVIGQALGHRSQAVTARYAPLSNAALRNAVNNAGRVVTGAKQAAAPGKDRDDDERGKD